MRYDKQRPFKNAGPILVLLSVLIFHSCQGSLPEVPTKQEFTKEKLEKLGGLLQPAMLANHQFLPDLPPYDTSVYWYVQTLYNQATYAMHLDKQSAPGNRWNQDREWRVFIIDDDNLQHAFTLPGGDLFISTGMLRSFKKEYELYALLTFEASLMHEGHLLTRLILEYNSLTINNVIEGNEGVNETTAASIAEDLPYLIFDAAAIKNNDRQTIASICESSILDPTGIGPLLLNPDAASAFWLKTRPSYEGRTSMLGAIQAEQSFCGDKKGTGNYERFVLNVLD